MGFIQKLMISYSILIIAFMVVLIGVAYQYIAEVSKQTSSTNQSQLLTKISSQVESYLDEMYKMGAQVAADTRIINMFSELQELDEQENYFDQSILDYIDVGSILTSYNAPDYPIWRISVYNQFGDYVSTGLNGQSEKYISVGENDIESYMLTLHTQKQTQKDSKHYLLISHPALGGGGGGAQNENASIEYIAILIPITNYYADEVYGIVEIQQSIDKLEESIALDQLVDVATVYLFDEDVNQILPLDRDYSSLNENSYYITENSLEEYGWHLSLALDRSSTVKPYQGILGYIIAACLLILVLLMAAIYLITRRVAAPLTELSKKARQTTLENVPIFPVQDSSMDEVRELNMAFTTMLERLTKSLAYEKRAYLLALQSQMDPHFLYNILTIISGMGLESGNTEITYICEKVSAIMRYNASFSDSYVTLNDEVENAKNYLELMKIRYEDYFSYTIDVNESLESTKIPRQVFQPILENCFEHGFKEVPPPWKIDISADIHDGRWFIRIADNGIGFGIEELDKLKRKVDEYSRNLPKNYSELKIGGLGLLNTILRLKLLLGEDMEFNIIQNTPRGTVILLREGT